MLPHHVDTSRVALRPDLPTGPHRAEPGARTVAPHVVPMPIELRSPRSLPTVLHGAGIEAQQLLDRVASMLASPGNLL